MPVAGGVREMTKRGKNPVFEPAGGGKPGRGPAEAGTTNWRDSAGRGIGHASRARSAGMARFGPLWHLLALSVTGFWRAPGKAKGKGRWNCNTRWATA
jgi:hypothetical protein